MNKTLLKPKEVAARLNVSVRTVQLWIRDGKLPAHRFGARSLRINLVDLERFEAETKGGTDGTAARS